MKLTHSQLDEIRKEMLPNYDGAVPVRFIINGQNVQNLETGDLARRGTNVIHCTVYWRFTRETANKIANWLGARAVFDQS